MILLRLPARSFLEDNLTLKMRIDGKVFFTILTLLIHLPATVSFTPIDVIFLSLSVQRAVQLLPFYPSHYPIQAASILQAF